MAFTPTADHYVLLSLGSRSDAETSLLTNRISLKADNISISTNKDVLAMPVPFSGIVTGSATKLALDFGVSTKNISISGIITEQTIYKKFDQDDYDYQDALTTSLSPKITLTTLETSMNMGAEEISQLIHSYVDSSFRQKRQNLDELIILIRSKINGDYQYYTGNDENTAIEDAKLIPFTYKVRDGGSNYFDASSSTDTQIGVWPTPVILAEDDIEGISGFVRSFSTTFIPGQPFVEFSLDFEAAINPF